MSDRSLGTCVMGCDGRRVDDESVRDERGCNAPGGVESKAWDVEGSGDPGLCECKERGGDIMCGGGSSGSLVSLTSPGQAEYSLRLAPTRGVERLITPPTSSTSASSPSSTGATGAVGVE